MRLNAVSIHVEPLGCKTRKNISLHISHEKRAENDRMRRKRAENAENANKLNNSTHTRPHVASSYPLSSLHPDSPGRLVVISIQCRWAS